jgi:cyclic pyranopterin phosphate synthase
MPLDADQRWDLDQVLSGDQVRAILESQFGPLVPAAREVPSQPAVDFRFADGMGRVGFINTVTAPFCSDCNRLRLTAEGQVRNCLFSTVEWDARAVLRSGGSDAQLAQLVHQCVAAKKAGHGTDNYDFVRPAKAMYELGG